MNCIFCLADRIKSFIKKSLTQRFGFAVRGKTKPRVLKLYKLLCFKTSFLLGTTAVRGGSEFCVRGKN
ncbi:hypothetical protein DWQ65_00765 [Treponema phagedenis]|uniref:Uncharacterized protein n=1 Tax=Treponema phagedenis TaxID=162 RepID=A0AAE6IVF8_TREPH|nr:hypothetical protein FUT79_03515 [Treponema phagedenis]QEJ98931.1 hypothetical protein FUT82_13615 [Treponema phagedenis]QSH93800.1 hypothetical protein C5O78_01795 [Treponema phagedenis]QSH98621.1 hypothetical protein DWQ65_00765 [Treponema phagedenis]